jgi:hypothetical protein
MPIKRKWDIKKSAKCEKKKGASKQLYNMDFLEGRGIGKKREKREGEG